MRGLTSIVRAIQRAWYWDRNNHISSVWKGVKAILDRRFEVVVKIPVDRREEVCTADPVLKVCLEIHRYLEGYFAQLGVK